MSAAAAIPSLFPLFVVIAKRRAEWRIHRQLADARATTEGSAIALTLRRSLDKRRLQGLVQGGAVRRTPDERYYLDAEGWNTHLENRQRRTLTALAVVVALGGIAFAVAYSLR